MSEVKRNKGEQFEGYMRRVKKGWQSSGRIPESKKRQYFKGKPTKTARRKSALSRLETKGRMEYLRNAGKLSKQQLADLQKRAK